MVAVPSRVRLVQDLNRGEHSLINCGKAAEQTRARRRRS